MKEEYYTTLYSHKRVSSVQNFHENLQNQRKDNDNQHFIELIARSVSQY